MKDEMGFEVDDCICIFHAGWIIAKILEIKEYTYYIYVLQIKKDQRTDIRIKGRYYLAIHEGIEVINITKSYGISVDEELDYNEAQMLYELCSCDDYISSSNLI